MSVLRRAHPFTVLTLSGAMIAIAIVAPDVRLHLLLIAAGVVLALSGQAWRMPLAAGAAALPFWVFLLVIHGLIRGDVPTAVALAGRLTAIIVAFALSLAVIQPPRLLDAALARHVPFDVAHLLMAALQAVPRLRSRARSIIEAQRCRGLRISGAPWRRALALVPLFLPLIFGALSEVDERTMALEARAARAGRRRTPLQPPVDTPADRVTRAVLILLVLAVIAARWIQ